MQRLLYLGLETFLQEPPLQKVLPIVVLKIHEPSLPQWNVRSDGMLTFSVTVSTYMAVASRGSPDQQKSNKYSSKTYKLSDRGLECYVMILYIEESQIVTKCGTT